MFNVVSGAVKALSGAGIYLLEGMGGGKLPGNWEGKVEKVKEKVKEVKAEVKAEAKEMKDEAKAKAAQEAAEWGYGMDDFIGFGGTKGGPIEGFLKVMQMMM
jgi:hypothetical protein